MIVFRQKGDLRKTTRFLEKASRFRVETILQKYAQAGVDALAESTPKDSGVTAESWGYEIKSNSQGASIYWTNTNINDGVPIAVILQYGHGTGTGGYVEGRDYIRPAIRPIFDQIAESAWKEVVKG